MYSSVVEDSVDVEQGIAGLPKATIVKVIPSSRDDKTKHVLVGHTSHFWVSENEIYGGGHSRTAKTGFIQKVYGILSAQLGLTVMIAGMCMGIENLRHWLIGNGITIMWVCLIPTFLSIFALFRYKDDYPTNFILLGFFTIMESLSIGVVCAIYSEVGYGMLILQAVTITAGVFFGLTVFAFQTKVDFTVYSGLFSTLLLSLIIWGFISSLLGFAAGGVYSWLGAFIFCGYIVIDTQMIMTRLGYDDYIIAAIELYLDILNMFLFILQILSSNRRRSS